MQKNCLVVQKKKRKKDKLGRWQVVVWWMGWAEKGNERNFLAPVLLCESPKKNCQKPDLIFKSPPKLTKFFLRIIKKFQKPVLLLENSRNCGKPTEKSPKTVSLPLLRFFTAVKNVHIPFQVRLEGDQDVAARFMRTVAALSKAGGNFKLTKATARKFKQLAALLGPGPETCCSYFPLQRKKVSRNVAAKPLETLWCYMERLEQKATLCHQQGSPHLYLKCNPYQNAHFFY